MERLQETKAIGRTWISRREILKDSLALASGFLWMPRILTAAGRQQGESAESKVQTWTIANGSIERTIVFDPKSGLSTRKLRTAFAEYFTAGSSAERIAHEFSFKCDQRDCVGGSADFTLLSAAQSSIRNGNALTVHLRHKALPLDVSLVYRVYDGHPAVRKHLVLKNTGTTSLHISHMNIESLALTLGPANEITLLTQYGTVPRETFYTGRSEDAGLLLASSKTGSGVAILSEVPGYMKRTEIGGWDAADAVPIGVMYDTDLMPFERSLAPGEEFATAAASLVAFQRGAAFNDPHWTVPSYTSKVLERRVNEKGAPWIYNTWEPFERGINHQTVLELIEAASAMKMDIFTIDDGWQAEYGENRIDAKAFPNGLQPIQDALDAKGMRLGLWIPMAAIGETTSGYRREWAALDLQGELKTTGTAAGTKAVMCMATGYRDAAAERINDAIEKFRLAYVKLDLTTIFNAYGEAPGCWAKGHDHADWAESLNRIYEGISYVTAKVYEKHPDVLLDLTFELWGQKHIIDAGLLAAGDLDWMSNVDDREKDSAGPLQARQLLYARAATMPAEAMLIGNIHADLPTIEESFATAIGSAPLLLGDLRKLSAADRAWYAERIAWFKKFRQQHAISESFFPLGSWQQTTSDAWDGFARFDRSGNGVISLFRNHSNAKQAVVQLAQLPRGNFKLRSIISGTDIGAFTSADWTRGIPIPFTGPHRVEVLEVTSSS